MSLSEDLLNGICQPAPFPRTQFPFPVAQSFFERDFHWDILEDKVEEIDESRVVEHLPLILALAEGVEASQLDREELFISDNELQRHLAALSDSSGWALVWGDGGGEVIQLLKLLQKERYLTFVVSPQAPSGIFGITYFGSRPTSVIYFLQALIRFSHIYGRIPLGDKEGVTHFLEEHGPGVIFWLKTKPSTLEVALLLGMMSLGTPAVVPSSFIPPIGHFRRAGSPQDMVKQSLQFPNIGVRPRKYPGRPLHGGVD